MNRTMEKFLQFSFLIRFIRSSVAWLLISSAAILSGCSTVGKGHAGWRITFQDEFEGNTLDLQKWNPNDPWGLERNSELQAYVKDAFEVKNGILYIRAQKRDAFYDGKERHFTSGMMTTHQKFNQQYGRFEIRCRIPQGKGLWPAFWLLPEPLSWPPEIDVLEFIGQEPHRIAMTHHFKDETGKLHSIGGNWIGPDFSKKFHVFAVEWTPERITWFVDGVPRFQSDESIPRAKMYLLVNLAVGGTWPKDPDDKTVFPSAFEVDYIRVYEKTP